ncbi:GNAT family protein [Caenispirillum bisanense]|uniref:GNAT family N-acetyltransferase n=1 Tax=Caenispirillum bisanense TaxID=414052 RepID=UPI0031E036CB
MPLNTLGQPVGAEVADWTPRPTPPRTALAGRRCRLEPLDPARHAEDLWQAACADADGRTWTYMSYGPFADAAAMRAFLTTFAATEDPQAFAIIDTASGRAVGWATYLRIDPANGVIEVGHIWYSPLLARTAAATEAMYLMMRRVFDELGYRRYEWKCNDLNAPSRRAAERLGFTYEGTFRQAMVTRGRNRDTAWYALIDSDWPAVRAAFEAWLADDNFDADGRQKTPLRTP